MYTAVLILGALGGLLFLTVAAIRFMATYNILLTNYPRQGTLKPTQLGDSIGKIIDGDVKPKGLLQLFLYKITRAYWVGIFEKVTKIVWEIRTLKINEDTGPEGVEPKKIILTDSIPRKFPVAVDAPVLDSKNLPARLLMNFIFVVETGSELEFIKYIKNTPDWIETLLGIMLNYTKEYAKSKTIKQMKEDNTVDRNVITSPTNPSFQQHFLKVNAGDDGIPKVIHIRLISTALVDLFEEGDKETAEALKKSGLKELEMAAQLAEETGKTKVAEQHVLTMKKIQEANNIEIAMKAKEVTDVIVPAVQGGAGEIFMFKEIKDSNITTWAPGANVVVGANGKTAEKPDKTDPAKPDQPQNSTVTTGVPHEDEKEKEKHSETIKTEPHDTEQEQHPKH